jgi:hypothetical protein
MAPNAEEELKDFENLAIGGGVANHEMSVLMN